MISEKQKQEHEEIERLAWNDAIDTVLEMLRIHPPSRVGEAAFMRRLINLKRKKGQ
jgi:hypothetical protein